MSGVRRLESHLKTKMMMRRVYVRSRCCCVPRRLCRECGPAVTCATVRGPVSPTPVVRGSHTPYTAGTRYRDVSGTPPLPLHNEPKNMCPLRYIHKHCRGNTTLSDGTTLFIVYLVFSMNIMLIIAILPNKTHNETHLHHTNWN